MIELMLSGERVYAHVPIHKSHCAHIVRAEARFSIVKRPIVIAKTYPCRGCP